MHQAEFKFNSSMFQSIFTDDLEYIIDSASGKYFPNLAKLRLKWSYKSEECDNLSFYNLLTSVEKKELLLLIQNKNE